MDGRDVKRMHQIMLRFRPIAPKPLGDGGSEGGYADPAVKDVIGKRRTKRKYVRVKKKDVKKKDKAVEMGDSESAAVTLELLPTQQQQQQQVYNKDLRGNSCEGVVQRNTNIFNTSCTNQEVDVRRGVVGSFVRVECVTDVWSGCMDEDDDGDEEMVRNLDVDTCPGFVSDGGGEVRWVNQAYRKMVGGEEEVVVVGRVVMKVGLLPVVGRGGGFSCRVIVYGNDDNYNKHKFTQTTVLPCDVWRMEFGGFAWRLDVQAALSLGR